MSALVTAALVFYAEAPPSPPLVSSYRRRAEDHVVRLAASVPLLPLHPAGPHGTAQGSPLCDGDRLTLCLYMHDGWRDQTTPSPPGPFNQLLPQL